ncbi:MAG: DUF748 domain-containing protein [Bacteroidetes bacterium]|nr:DUF748 domain-containing protein [Bacteroidota bacterium]HET6245668.1 DUF748 domain-containing protein [Bacteroidia bacterium]
MKKQNNKNNRRWIWALLVLFIVLIVAVRLLLPVILLKYVNNELDKNSDYEGKIGDLKLAILAGKYSIRDISIDEVDSQIREPLLTIDEVWFKLDYGSLFKGKIVGSIEIVKPEINFVAGPTKEESRQEVEEDLAETINQFMPVRINKLNVTNGKIRFIDFTTQPNIDLQAYNIDIEASNLTSLPTPDTLLPSKVVGFANTTGQGRLYIHMKLDPLNKVPTFDLNMDLKKLQLKALNDFIRKYGNINVEAGTFNLHTEIAAKEGYFVGYAKPLVNDLKVAPLENQQRGLLQRLYEAGVAVIANILESREPEKDQVGTRIPLEGKLVDPNVKVWTAVAFLLRNAFIQALVPSIDNSIAIGDVEEVKQEERKDNNPGDKDKKQQK